MGFFSQSIFVSPGGSVDSVNGTPGRITSTGGANPMINIDATYVGQTSIITVGTLTTGGVGGAFTPITNAYINDVAWAKITGTPTTLAGYGITDALSTTLVDGKIFIGNGSNIATAATPTGDVTISNAGVTTIGAGKVTNAMLAGGIDLTTKVTGTLPIANGGTNSATASGARANLGATTIGSNFFTLANPSAITFPRINADNSVSTLDAASFRTAIGAGTGSGSVISVGLLLGTSGTDLSISGSPITTSGDITLNVPDASATARGVITTGTQTIAGTKTFSSTISGSITGNAGTATALATGRTISISGDLTYTSPSFDGSANVTAAGTLATVNSNVGSFTNASITVNAKGLITAASSGSAPEVPLTFSTGLTRTVNTITANLSTGVSGGQTAIGGTGLTDALTFKSSTANTTASATAFSFTGGNDGATTIASMFNDGQVLFGTTTRLGATLANVRIAGGSATSGVDIGNSAAGTNAIWMGLPFATAQTTTNYTLSNDNTNTNLRGVGRVRLITGTSTVLNIQGTGNEIQWTPVAFSGTATSSWAYTQPANTGMTASTEAVSVKWDLSAAVQHATGALTLQRGMAILAPTYSFVGASTATDIATFGISGAAITGTNGTTTNTHGILISSASVTAGPTVTNSYGITVNAMTGATNNYSGNFVGGLGCLIDKLNVGNAVTTTQRVLRVGQDIAIINIGSLSNSTSFGGIGFTNLTMTLANAALYGTGITTWLNATNTVDISVNNVDKMLITANAFTITPGASTSGTTPGWTYTAPANTGQTAGTEAVSVLWDLSATMQHASNTTISLQRDYRISARTHSFATAGGGVITDLATAAFSAPISGTNAAPTNVHGLLIETVNTDGAGAAPTNSYGITCNAMTGGSTLNAAAQFLGGQVIMAAGTTTYAPLTLLSGTNRTTANAGDFEYNGTNLFFTRTGTTRENVFVGNDAAAAPATNTIGAILDYYGTSATRVLTTPNSWASVVISGVTYKIPLYS